MSDKDQQLAERCAEAMYKQDRASRALGMQLEEIAPGFSKISMVVQEHMLNGHDNCHGGYIFTLGDSCFGLACNTYNQITVAQGCSIDYVRPAKLGDRLLATAREQSRGKTTGLYDVEIVREDGKPIAFFRGKSFATSQPLLTK